ncbi:hypothetical protein EP105_11630 [Shigella sonnei]|nr:hypothetical protein [Shigella sonnei]
MILLNGVSGTGCVLLSAQPGRNAAVAATINKMVDFMVFLHISGKRKPARGGLLDRFKISAGICHVIDVAAFSFSHRNHKQNDLLRRRK